MPEFINGDPKSVSALDDEFTPARNYHRARWYTMGCVVVAIIGVLAFLVVLSTGQQNTIRSQQQTIADQQREIASSCSFWRTLGVFPVTNVPGTSKPSPVTITLLAESRNTFLGEKCGTLPPPSAALLHWTAVYHVPLTETGAR